MVVSFEDYYAALSKALSRLSNVAHTAVLTVSATRARRRCESAFMSELRPAEQATIEEAARVLEEHITGVRDAAVDFGSLKQRLAEVRSEDDVRAIDTHPLLTDYLVVLDAAVARL